MEPIFASVPAIYRGDLFFTRGRGSCSSESPRTVGEKTHSTATICTDSLSLQKALDEWKDAQDWLRKIKEKSYTLKTEVSNLWLPLHCGCEGNEEAYQLADKGTKLDQTNIPITFAITKARVRKRQWEVTHERAKQVYGDRKKPKLKLESKWPRSVQ